MRSSFAIELNPRLKYIVRILLTIFVVLIAGWLRLRAVRLLPIDFDEDDYLLAAQEYSGVIKERDWPALMQLNYRPEHPPLAKIIYGAVLSTLPAAEPIPDRPTTAPQANSLPQPHLTKARTSAALFGTLEVLLLAALNPLAGLFLGIHTFTIKYHSQVMLEALPALTSALSVVAYERSRVYEHGRWTGWLALSAVMLGMTAASKYIFCLVGVAILLHWVGSWWRERRSSIHLFLNLLGWGILSVAIFMAFDPYLWPAPVSRLLQSVLYHSAYATGDSVQNVGFPIWQPFVWLFGSVPWHPGVFVLSLDLIITLLALAGLRRLVNRRPLYAVWLGVTLVFLLIWPTKWPQYVLVLTFPLSLAAAEGFGVLLWEPAKSWLTRRQTGEHVKRHQAYSRRELRNALLWLLPGVIIITGITFYPLLYQTGIALTDLTTASIRDGLNGGIAREAVGGLLGLVEAHPTTLLERPSSTEVRYIGFQLLGSAMLQSADLLFFEVLWTGLVVSLQVLLGVIVALLLNQPGVRLKAFWMTLFILPWALPEFIGALSWLQIFDPYSGWFALAGQNIPHDVVIDNVAHWQEDPTLTLLVLLLTGTWMGWPLMMLAATAGLKMIPHDVYHAAAIDGASRWQIFRRITWPMLLPLLAPVIILRVIAAFNQFYLMFVLQPPFPLTTLATLTYYLASPGYFGGWFGAAAAISMLTVLALLIMLLWFNKWSKASEGVTYA